MDMNRCGSRITELREDTWWGLPRFVHNEPLVASEMKASRRCILDYYASHLGSPHDRSKPIIRDDTNCGSCITKLQDDTTEELGDDNEEETAG
jgi:hypothetical protein